MKQATLQYKTLILIAAFFVYGIFQVRQAIIMLSSNEHVSEIMEKSNTNTKLNLSPVNTMEYTLANTGEKACFFNNEKEYQAFNKQTIAKQSGNSLLKNQSKALPYDWSIFSLLVFFEYSSRQL